MKIFQVLDNMCHWDATPKHPTLADTVGKYAPNITFVEAPDNVFEGWAYINGEFIRPEVPEGWAYDDTNGTFYPIDESGQAVLPEMNNYGVSNDTYNAIIDSYTLQLIESGVL